MKAYCKKHEILMNTAISKNEIDASLLGYHHLRICWLQHERLVHLLTLMLTAILFVIFFLIALWIGGILYYSLAGILMGLTFFYILHYYYLENTIQRWYEISDELEKRINESCKI